MDPFCSTNEAEYPLLYGPLTSDSLSVAQAALPQASSRQRVEDWNFPAAPSRAESATPFNYNSVLLQSHGQLEETSNHNSDLNAQTSNWFGNSYSSTHGNTQTNARFAFNGDSNRSNDASYSLDATAYGPGNGDHGASNLNCQNPAFGDTMDFIGFSTGNGRFGAYSSMYEAQNRTQDAGPSSGTAMNNGFETVNRHNNEDISWHDSGAVAYGPDTFKRYLRTERCAWSGLHRLVEPNTDRIALLGSPLADLDPNLSARVPRFPTQNIYSAVSSRSRPLRAHQPDILPINMLRSKMNTPVQFQVPGLAAPGLSVRTEYSAGNETEIDPTGILTWQLPVEENHRDVDHRATREGESRIAEPSFASEDQEEELEDMSVEEDWMNEKGQKNETESEEEADEAKATPTTLPPTLTGKPRRAKTMAIGSRVRDIPGFPPRDIPVPLDISLYQACQQYPQSLEGDIIKDFLRLKWTGCMVFKYLAHPYKLYVRSRITNSKNHANIFNKRLNAMRYKLKRAGQYDAWMMSVPLRTDGRPAAFNLTGYASVKDTAAVTADAAGDQDQMPSRVPRKRKLVSEQDAPSDSPPTPRAIRRTPASNKKRKTIAYGSVLDFDNIGEASGGATGANTSDA